MARTLILLSILLVICSLTQSAPSGDTTEGSIPDETTLSPEEPVTPAEPPLIFQNAPVVNRDHSPLQNGKEKLGNSCNSDDDCTVANSSCQGEVCSCDTSYVKYPGEDRCLPVAHRLRDECEINEQCLEGIHPQTHGRTKCLDMRCVCAPGLQESDGKCIGKSKLGGSCNSDQECTIEHSKCLQSVCTCPSAFIPNAANDKCTRKAGSFNDSCSMDEQCEDLGDAICKGSKCVCKAMMILVNGKCAMIKELGGDCSSSSECQTNLPSDQRECINNVCNCTRGFFQQEDICVKSGSSTIRMSIFTLVTTLILKYFLV